MIFGIDGGTWTVLKMAMEGGYMPFLKELVDSGASGILESTMPAITPAAWGSFQTGTNCGKTGVFDFAYWDKFSKKPHYVSSETLPVTIWEMASTVGKRVGVVNVPMTYPPRKINGCVITGIMTPSLKSDFTFPQELKESLLESVPDYHIFSLKSATEGSPHDNFESFVQQMVEIADNRTKAALFLLAKEKFDLFMLHYQTTDIIQHVMWGYMDKDHSLYDPDKCEYIFKIFYKFLDEKIELVCDTFAKQNGNDFLTLLVSDHGQEAHNKRVNLGNWLCEQGLLKIHPVSKKRSWLKKVTSVLKVGKLLRNFVSEESVKKLEQSAGLNFGQVDWPRSKAFSFGRSGEGFIYLFNENDQENKSIKDDIISGLKRLIDTETGENVVKNIFRKEDIYSGSFMDRIPDLIIEPVSGYSFTGLSQGNKGLFYKVETATDFHIGKHHKNGIIVANGKDVKKSDAIFSRIIDIVPTLLYYLQLPIQDDLDGTVVFELFNDEFKKLNVMQESKIYKTAGDGNKTDYSKSEELEIEQRLKDLGYI